MGGWYEVSGKTRCRDSPEFREVVDAFDDVFGEGFEVVVRATDEQGIVEVLISGGTSTSWGHMSDIDDAIGDLTPHAVGAACFTTGGDGGDGIVYVGDPALEREACSAHMLDDLATKYDFGDLTPSDAEKLIKRIRRATKKKKEADS